MALVTTTQKEWLEGVGPCETDAPAQGVPEARESRKAEAEPAYLTEQAVLEGFAKKLRALTLEGTLAGILHTKNDSLADVVQSDGTDILYGQDYFYEELLGLRFKITPFSFFQTNSLGAEVLYRTVREYIGDTKGQVVLTCTAAPEPLPRFWRPCGEGCGRGDCGGGGGGCAGERGQERPCQLRIYRRGCAEGGGDLKDKPDLIVLDPPRDGVHPKALGRIIDFGVKRIVYVSCKPTSLARDLAVLQERGYRAERICCVDMFPFTGNCEVVALLTSVFT